MMSLALGASLPAVAFASAELTPPTVAPVLALSIEFGGYSVTLDWTASNKTGSAGFGYKAYSSPDNSAFTEFYDGTNQSANFDAALGREGMWYFKVIPYNDAGDGPESNIASVEIPGT